VIRKKRKRRIGKDIFFLKGNKMLSAGLWRVGNAMMLRLMVDSSLFYFLGFYWEASFDRHAFVRGGVP